MTVEETPPSTEPDPTSQPVMPALGAPVFPVEAAEEISQEIVESVPEAADVVESIPAQSSPLPIESEQAVPEVETPKPSAPAQAQLPVGSQSVRVVPSAPKQTPGTSRPSVGAHMREVVRSRKQARLEKVMEMAREKGSIVNDDVEKLLKVSDATATRYLNALVVAARLRRSGHAGGARYEPV